MSFRYLFIVAALTAYTIHTSASVADQQKEITARQSPLYFALDVPQKIVDAGWDAEYSMRTYSITSIPTSPIDPRAEIILINMAPGYYMEWVTEAEGMVEKFRFFTKGGKATGSQQPANLGHFLSTYVKARAHGRECVVFAGKQGQGGGDLAVSEGTAYMTGYYCQPATDPLDADAIRTVLGAIGLKAIDTSGPVKIPAPIPE